LPLSKLHPVKKADFVPSMIVGFTFTGSVWRFIFYFSNIVNRDSLTI